MLKRSTYAVFILKQQGPVMISLLVPLLVMICPVSFAQSSADTIAKSRAERPSVRAAVPEILPGKGLAQHNFLYAGEWDTRKDTQTIFRVMDGKVVWTWSIPIKDHNGQLSEFTDIHQLSDA